MTDSEKTQSSNEWRTYRERNAQLTKHRGQGFLLILGQCTQLLQDKMKQDTEWNVVRTSYEPLSLYRLIEKTVLGQTEDQYPFATVYNQEIGFLCIQARQSIQPTVVQAVQYKGGYRRSNWRDPTTQGTPGVCGSGAIHSNLLCTDGCRTASYT